MKTVGVYEAKTRLPSLLAQAAKGERITITRHGVPVAMLVPPPEAPKRSAADVITLLREFRKGRRLGGLSLDRLIAEGRR
jgi:prevent-host-death family protein